MLKYLVKRLLQAVPLLILITILCFTLINLAPYDAIDAQVTEDMTAEDVARLREESGLNDPVPVQYIRWVGNVLQGDLGKSLISRTNIAEDLKVKIPNTIKLVLPSYATAFILAIGLGLLSGRYKNSWVDKLINSFAS
ncbi:MAG: ABC transporter permease, partial [Oscillospiraceae bacterium]|nr:ABC transporter permease [Oscillospiraceae bacterium]